MSTNYTYQQLYTAIKEAGVHPALGEYGAGWSIEQNPHELAVFLHAMQTLGVRSCLELGTGAYGGLARFMIERMNWQVWSVDKNAPHYYPGAGVFTQLTTEEARKHFHIDQFDLVFIDADHSFDAVKIDYAVYGDVARLAVGFHDIAGLRDCEGSKRFWDAISRSIIRLRGEWVHEAYLDNGKPIPRQYGAPIYSGFYEVIENSPQKAGIGWIVKSEVDTVTTVTVDPIADYEQVRQLKPKRQRKAKNA